MSEEPKSYVVAHIRERLAEDPRVNELAIDVTVTAGKVFLTGTVSSDERRESITEVVRELLPDHEIYNETSVVSAEEPREAERLP